MRTVLALLSVLIIGYLYCIFSSILNVMSEREAQVRTQHIQNDISALEINYFSLSKSIKPEDGLAMGLIALDKPLYVTRPPEVGGAITRSGL